MTLFDLRDGAVKSHFDLSVDNAHTQQRGEKRAIIARERPSLSVDLQRSTRSTRSGAGSHARISDCPIRSRCSSLPDFIRAPTRTAPTRRFSLDDMLIAATVERARLGQKWSAFRLTRIDPTAHNGWRGGTGGESRGHAARVTSGAAIVNRPTLTARVE